MVKIANVIASNARFADACHSGLVCIFAGATMGIGRVTLERLAKTVQSSTFYVLGRSPSRYAEWLDQLRKSAPTSTIHFVETDCSLISDIDAACKRISLFEQKVDIVCLSPKGMPWQGVVYTSEGLDTCFTVSYYARVRLISKLMPLLCKSPQPRVLSILAGSMEMKINEDDIGLDGGWLPLSIAKHTTLFTSLALDHLSKNDEEKKIVFIHSYPGLVNTGTPRTWAFPEGVSVAWRAFASAMQVLSTLTMRWLGGTLDESGARMVYYLTSDYYRPGSWRTNSVNDIVPDNKVLIDYRNRGWEQNIWDHTERVWEKALTVLND